MVAPVFVSVLQSRDLASLNAKATRVALCLFMRQRGGERGEGKEEMVSGRDGRSKEALPRRGRANGGARDWTIRRLDAGMDLRRIDRSTDRAKRADTLPAIQWTIFERREQWPIARSDRDDGPLSFR